MLWLLALTIILMPSYLIRFSIFGIPTTVLELLIYFSAFWLLISQPIQTTKERLLPTLRRYGLPIVLFILGAAIATAIAPDKRAAFGLLKAYIIDPIIFFLVIVASNHKHKSTMIASALIGSGLLVALSALISPENPEGRALGIYYLDHTASPNFLALFLTPLISLSLVQTVKTSSYIRIFSLVSFLVMTVALILSGSRGGLFAAGVGIGLVVLGLLAEKAKKSWLGVIRGLAVGFLLVVLAVGWFSAKPDFSSQPSHRVATSNNLRYEIWRTTIVDILPKNYLVGVGLGNYQDYFRRVTLDRVNFPEFIAPWALTPHNIFLTIWVNLGLIGLVAFIWLLVLFFKQKKHTLQLVLTVVVVTLLIHGLVDAAYWKNDLALLFWTILALGISSEADYA